MKHLLIIHEVEDYTAWKKVFDNAAGIRKEAGETSFQVFRYDGAPNKVVHLSQWNDMQHAMQFFNSPRLVQIRAEAGVKAPEFIYLDLVDEGVL